MTSITITFDLAALLLSMLVIGQIGLNIYVLLFLRGIATNTIETISKTLKLPSMAKKALLGRDGGAIDPQDLLDSVAQATGVKKDDINKLIKQYAPMLQQQSDGNPLMSILAKAGSGGKLSLNDFVPLLLPIIQGMRQGGASSESGGNPW